MASLDVTAQVADLKGKGNQFFATGKIYNNPCRGSDLFDAGSLFAGKFTEADAAYTAALALDSKQEALWSNRAAARLKLGRFEVRMIEVPPAGCSRCNGALARNRRPSRMQSSAFEQIPPSSKATTARPLLTKQPVTSRRSTRWLGSSASYA